MLDTATAGVTHTHGSTHAPPLPTPVGTSSLTQARLQEVLDYDPETGIFRWKVDRHRVKAGDLAGSIDASGYMKIVIDQTQYYAHRLAWLYVYGQFPDSFISPIGEKTDNRISNLRLTTDAQNQHKRRIRIDSSTGIKGLSFHCQHLVYQAQVMCDGKLYQKAFSFSKHGSLNAAKQAAKEWLRAKREELHGEFANHG